MSTSAVPCARKVVAIIKLVVVNKADKETGCMVQLATHHNKKNKYK